jgi:nucleotide-binding universal stress UspA family protein
MDSATTGVHPVVVGVDASGAARDAAEWAADLAAAWGAPLLVVHTVSGALDEPPIPVVPDWLRELADNAERSGAGPVQTEIVPGGTVELLVHRARHARLLVLGSYGEAAWSGMLAGAVALAVTARAGVPVAVVRGAAPGVPPPRGGPVVVGVDGSASARGIAEWAAGVAAALGARLVAVHIATRPAGAAAPVAADAVALDAELAGVRMRYPGLDVERAGATDAALPALLRRAAEARMLVVGRGPAIPGSLTATLGSTSRALVERARCPVVVVPGDPEPDDDGGGRIAGSPEAAVERS